MEKQMFIGNKINSGKFSYKNKCFSAFDSDLPRNLVKQVWNDACDEGFAIVSEKTGKEVIVTFCKIYKNKDGDVTHWEFKPYRNNTFDRVVIFNT
jgi:hypothetical protein